MGSFGRDLRYAFRQLRLAPGFAATVVLTLALGIGATTAIFTLVNAVMLRSLPVVNPSTLYRIGDNQECCVRGGPTDDGDWGMMGYPLFVRLRAALPQFEDITAFQAGLTGLSVRREGSNQPAKPLTGEFVTGNYFRVFGLQPFAGRMIAPSDDSRTAPPVAVMSYRVWQQEYGADPKVVGSTFYLQGHPFTIIGISPPGWFGDTVRDYPPSFWLPMQQEPMVQGSGTILEQTIPNWLRAIGRVKPGSNPTAMAARATAVLQQWIPDSGIAALVPSGQQSVFAAILKKQHFGIIPAGSGVGVMQEDYGKSLKVLLLICASVLLIACANIANLLLARSTVRRHNTSLQMALGAQRGRLIYEALLESLVLSLVGGAVGVALAYLGTRAILAMEFKNAHFLPISPVPSLPVLLFALGVSVLTGILFGTAPAYMATHANPVEALRGANRSTRDAASLPQKALVILQVMLSVVLLTGAGMLVHSLSNLQHRDFGFDTTHRVMVEFNPPPANYTREHLQSLYRDLQTRLLQIPGVDRAALAMYTPYTDNWGEGIVVEGKQSNILEDHTGSSWDRVSAGYFQTIGQNVLRGRGITDQDTATTRNVAVVNQAFAKHFFPHEDAIGHRFGMDVQKYAGSFEIVGIVRDSRYRDTASTEPTNPMFFIPLTQTVKYDEPIMEEVQERSFFLHSAVLVYHGKLDTLEPQLRKAFQQVDPDLPVTDIRTFDERIAGNFDQQRTVAQLAGMFSGLALILAAVGLYGVTAYAVARRTNEIGVRMALGADRGRVVRLVLTSAMTQLAVGLAIGVPAAFAAANLLSAQLYAVGAWNPLPVLTAVFLLIVCAIAAALIPARRAASLDPMRALRTE